MSDVPTPAPANTAPPPAPKEKPDEVLITFQQNRRFELHVAGDMIIFGPYESKALPRKIIKNPDFQQVAGFFNVQEVPKWALN